jgi:hypothetical protein
MTNDDGGPEASAGPRSPSAICVHSFSMAGQLYRWADLGKLIGGASGMVLEQVEEADEPVAILARLQILYSSVHRRLYAPQRPANVPPLILSVDPPESRSSKACRLSFRLAPTGDDGPGSIVGRPLGMSSGRKRLSLRRGGT